MQRASCPGRGAPLSPLPRRAGTHEKAGVLMDPDQQRTANAPRSIRGTRKISHPYAAPCRGKAGMIRNEYSLGLGKSKAPGTNGAGSGNEGVGEHVRTRFHWGKEIAGEIADLRSAPNEENLFLLPDRFSKERTPRKVDPAV